MEAAVLQENFKEGLSKVVRFVASRSTLPVLSNVLIQTDGSDRLRLSATNLEVGINLWVAARVTQEGAVTIPARLLGEFVNSLPPERIDLKLDEDNQTLNLRCARFESNIKGISAAEFPVVPTASNGAAISLDPSSLKAMISQVVFAAASDESRPILTGVLVEFRQESLSMAAADGFRLSVKQSNGLSGIEPADAIIPAHALAELSRLIGDQEQPVEVTITPARKQILFHLENIDLVSQLIEGRFPDYTQIVPKGYTTRTVMDTASLLKAARVSHLFARDSANIVRLNIAPSDDPLVSGLVTLMATSAELGDNVADVDAMIEGDPIEIAFNVKYMIDALSILDSPQVALETSVASSPGVIRAIGDDKFTHVIMPMHITK